MRGLPVKARVRSEDRMLQFDDEVMAGGAVGLQAMSGFGLPGVGGFVPTATVSFVPQAKVPAPERADPPADHRRIRLEDKRIINGRTDVNQLVPFKYKWAWDKY